MYLLGGNDESFDASRGVGEAELVHPSSTFRERQPRKRLPTGNVRSKCTFYPPQETNPRDAFPAIRVKRRWTGINPLDPSGLTLPKTPLQPFAGETPDATFGGVSWWREDSPSGHATLGMPFPCFVCQTILERA